MEEEDVKQEDMEQKVRKNYARKTMRKDMNQEIGMGKKAEDIMSGYVKDYRIFGKFHEVSQVFYSLSKKKGSQEEYKRIIGVSSLQKSRS